MCVSELGQHWSRWWLICAKCYDIVNWTRRNKLQWNSNKNTKIFIDENAFENVVWEVAAILSRGGWVNWRDSKHPRIDSIIRWRSDTRKRLIDNWSWSIPGFLLSRIWWYRWFSTQNDVRTSLCCNDYIRTSYRRDEILSLRHLGSLLLTCNNFNLSMDKLSPAP